MNLNENLNSSINATKNTTIPTSIMTTSDLSKVLDVMSISHDQPLSTSSMTVTTTTSTANKTNTTGLSKQKNYRVKNTEWYCSKCDIYCNSDLQYDVHLMSQKHKTFQIKTTDQSQKPEENDNNNNTLMINKNNVDNEDTEKTNETDELKDEVTDKKKSISKMKIFLFTSSPS